MSLVPTLPLVACPAETLHTAPGNWSREKTADMWPRIKEEELRKNGYYQNAYMPTYGTGRNEDGMTASASNALRTTDIYAEKKWIGAE